MVTASPGSTATRSPCSSATSRTFVRLMLPMSSISNSPPSLTCKPRVQAGGERVGDADVGVVGAPDRQAAALGQRLREEQVRSHDQQMKRRRRQLHRRVEERG